MHPLGFIDLCHVVISHSEIVWRRAQWILHRSSRLTGPCACDFNSNWMATLSQSKPREWYLLYPLTPCIQVSNHNSIWHWCGGSEKTPEHPRLSQETWSKNVYSTDVSALSHTVTLPVHTKDESSAHQTPPENWSPRRCFGQPRSHMGCSCNVVEIEHVTFVWEAMVECSSCCNVERKVWRPRWQHQSKAQYRSQPAASMQDGTTSA